MENSDLELIHEEMPPHDLVVPTAALFHGEACFKVQFWVFQSSGEYTRFLGLAKTKLRNAVTYEVYNLYSWLK
jgi:hypothetical protein